MGAQGKAVGGARVLPAIRVQRRVNRVRGVCARRVVRARRPDGTSVTAECSGRNPSASTRPAPVAEPKVARAAYACHHRTAYTPSVRLAEGRQGVINEQPCPDETGE